MTCERLGFFRRIAVVLALVAIPVLGSGVSAADEALPPSAGAEPEASDPALPPPGPNGPAEPDAGEPTDPAPEPTEPPPEPVCPPGAEHFCDVPTPAPPAVATAPPPDQREAGSNAPVVSQVAAGLLLDVEPEKGSARTGAVHTLTVFVRDKAGDGVDGVGVDFEVTEGPGDDDVGTAGDTPTSPDLGCVSGGGGPGIPASCTVSYTEANNTGGADAVRAWADLDGHDATVEADLGEGRNEKGSAASTGGCHPRTASPGSVAEPDATDCVQHDWSKREATLLDVAPETASAPTSKSHVLLAVVLDQDGNLLAGEGTDTTVRFFFLTGSPHAATPGSITLQPDLRCHTGTEGRCSVTYLGQRPGTDTLCGALPHGRDLCGEPVAAPELDNAADVVTMTWLDPARGGTAGSATGPAGPSAPADPALAPGADTAPVSPRTTRIETRPVEQRSDDLDPDRSVAETFGRAAKALAQAAAFPGVLLLVVAAFLWVQNRIDRRDPKLARAPTDTNAELEFE